jgi:hypothetical protein
MDSDRVSKDEMVCAPFGEGARGWEGVSRASRSAGESAILFWANWPEEGKKATIMEDQQLDACIKINIQKILKNGRKGGAGSGVGEIGGNQQHLHQYRLFIISSAFNFVE